MKVAGIIAEYNPFHNGHQYQIEQIRSQTGADYVVVIMSGDFLQRGVPAITDKFVRAEMALHCGADLVLELPSIWALSSAERFASAGVFLLAQSGVVDFICYGAEHPNPALMQQLIKTITDNSGAYSDHLLTLQKQGLTYPAARARALYQFLNWDDEKSILAFLNAPNNILALEYENAIAKWNTSHENKLKGYAIKRQGGGYHDTVLYKEYSSASAIRTQLLSSTEESLSALHTQVPAFVLEQLQDITTQHALMDTDDFSDALFARLLSYRKTGYSQFADCSLDLSNKIINHLDQYTSFTSFAMLLKTKDITFTRICRVLMHILLDIRQEEYALYSPDSTDAYLRVLGFRKNATPLLSAIKKEASLPLVTKMADASQILTNDAKELLNHDIAAADLYRTIRSIRLGSSSRNEFNQPIVIV